MNDNTYDVLVNSCYGQFAFPPEVVNVVFARFPPNSVIGERLFPRIKDSLHIMGPVDEPDLSWDRYYVIQSVEPLTGEYQCVCADLYVRHDVEFHRFAEACPFFATADMATYYSLQNFTAYEWRTNPEIIRAACEADIIGKEIGGSRLIIEKIPIHCGFHILNDAGKEESVIDFPV